MIDDGSTDSTEAVVKKFKDERLHYYKMPQNGGQAAARNYGMEQAAYEWLAFEDSDDLWMPEKLEMQMKALDKYGSEPCMVYGRMRYDFGGGAYGVLPDAGMDTSRMEGNIYGQLLMDNLIGMPALLVHRACVEAAGGMDETLNCLEDYDFVLRIGKLFPAVFVDKVLVEATYSTDGVSGNSYHYIMASCKLIQKYKADYIQTGTLSHRLEIILRDAERLGILEQTAKLLEKIMEL